MLEDGPVPGILDTGMDDDELNARLLDRYHNPERGTFMGWQFYGVRGQFNDNPLHPGRQNLNIQTGHRRTPSAGRFA